MKQPGKWTNNRLDRAFKDWVNSVRDYLIDVSDRLTSTDKRLNARIDNLVAPGNKPSDDNEIRDARTDYDGKLYGSLKARLDNEWKRVLQFISETQSSIKQVSDKQTLTDNKLNKLFDDKTENIMIYVSKERGNDTTGTGTESKPFKSIQKAVDSIPIISLSQYQIVVDKGAYLEDVIVKNLTTARIDIVSYNYQALNITSDSTDTGVYVRSINFIDCRMYCGVRGFTQTDSKNNQTNRFVSFNGVNYGVAEKCLALENTKTRSNFKGFHWERSKGNIYESVVSNQFHAISADFASEVRVTDEMRGGTNNKIVFFVNGSVVYKGLQVKITGDQEEYLYYGGEVRSGGK